MTICLWPIHLLYRYHCKFATITMFSLLMVTQKLNFKREFVLFLLLWLFESIFQNSSVVILLLYPVIILLMADWSVIVSCRNGNMCRRLEAHCLTLPRQLMALARSAGLSSNEEISYWRLFSIQALLGSYLRGKQIHSIHSSTHVLAFSERRQPVYHYVQTFVSQSKWQFFSDLSYNSTDCRCTEILHKGVLLRS